MRAHNRKSDSGDEIPMVVKSPSVGELAIAGGRGGTDLETLFWVANRFPRDMGIIRSEIINAINSPAIAEKLLYRIPRRSKDGTTSEIEGISIRGAELLLQHMGNLLVRGYVEEREDGIYGIGMIIDLQRRIAVSNAVRMRQTIPGEDGRVMAENASISKAIRNALLRLVPPDIIEELMVRAREVVKRGVKRDSVHTRFQKAVKRFSAFGLTEGDLLNRLGVASADQLTEDHILQLLELYNAIEEGQVSPDTIKGTGEVSKPTSLGDILKGGK